VNTATPRKKVRKNRKVKTWKSIENFTDHLVVEHEDEEEPPRYLGDTPRKTLREPIWYMLRETGPLDSKALRGRVLGDAGLDNRSARIVNLHGLALSDLQRAGYVEAYTTIDRTKKGPARRSKVYEAVKKRIRVKVGRGPLPRPAAPVTERPPLDGTLREAILRALLPTYRTVRDLTERMNVDVDSRDVLKELNAMKAEGLVLVSSAHSHWKLKSEDDVSTVYHDVEEGPYDVVNVFTNKTHSLQRFDYPNGYSTWQWSDRMEIDGRMCWMMLENGESPKRFHLTAEARSALNAWIKKGY
jgi:hypothetical protein